MAGPPQRSLFPHRESLSKSATVKRYVDVMHSSWSGLLIDVSPGVSLALVAVLSAGVAYGLLRQRRRGRARSAIAYLSGLAVGLSATVLLGLLLRSHADMAGICRAGFAGAFFGPFAGMLRAKWEGPARRKRPGVLRSLTR
jgi:hypothetical protein